MENPPDPRPVFEADQVLTLYDLIGIRNGYIHQYKNTSWFNFDHRKRLQVGIVVCTEMLHWLAHGKPANGIECRGGHNYGF